jgi:hypothetical protein
MAVFMVGKQVAPNSIQFYILADNNNLRIPYASTTQLLYAAHITFTYDISTDMFIIVKDREWPPDPKNRRTTELVKTWLGININPVTRTFLDQKDKVFFLLSYQKYLDKRTELVYNEHSTNKELRCLD